MRSERQKIYLEQRHHVWRGLNGEAYTLSAGGEWDDRQDIAAGKGDATSLSLDRAVLFKVPSVTQGGDQVAEYDAYDDEDQGQAMNDV